MGGLLLSTIDIHETFNKAIRVPSMYHHLRILLTLFFTLSVAQHRIAENPLDPEHWLLRASKDIQATKNVQDPWKIPSFYDPSGSDLSLAHISIKSLFDRSDMQVLGSIADWYFAQTTEAAWKPVSTVSMQQPFIFFHQRKAGGTSVRENLVFASKARQMPSFVACFNGVPCDTYQIGRSQAYAVYAGHFKWGTQSDLARFHVSARETFSCATNFREPLSRIESCLYFRFSVKLNFRCLNELPLDEFARLLLWVDEYGQSCLNEPFRIISGENDESVIDNLFAASSASNSTLSAATLAIFNNTLLHLTRCTPILLEIPESYLVLSQRIFALGQSGAFSPFKHTNQGRQRCAALDSTRRQLIMEKAALEMVLYDVVYRKVKSKLQTFPGYPLHQQCLLNASNNFIYRLASGDEYSAALARSKDIASSNDAVPPFALVTSTSQEATSAIVQLVEAAAGFQIANDFLGSKTDPALLLNVSAVHLQAGTFQLLSDSSFNLSVYNCASQKGHCRNKHNILQRIQNVVVVVEDPFLRIFNELFANTTEHGKMNEATHLKHFLVWKQSRQQKTAPGDLFQYSLANLRNRRRLQAYKIMKRNEEELVVRLPSGKTQVIKLSPAQLIVPNNPAVSFQQNGKTSMSTTTKLQTVKGKKIIYNNAKLSPTRPDTKAEVLALDVESLRSTLRFASKESEDLFRLHYSVFVDSPTYVSVLQTLSKAKAKKAPILFISYQALMHESYLLLQDLISESQLGIDQSESLAKLLSFVSMQKARSNSSRLRCIFSYLQSFDPTMHDAMGRMDRFFKAYPKVFRTLQNWLRTELESAQHPSFAKQVHLYYPLV